MNLTISNDSREVKEFIQEGLRQLKRSDFQLLRSRANEQTITARLLLYYSKNLEKRQSGQSNKNSQLYAGDLVIDAEYNRHGYDIKRYKTKKGEWRMKPDIVIHQREFDSQNLIAIEFKKYNAGTNCKSKITEADDRKLKSLTDQRGDYKYNYGFFIEIPVGERAIESPFKITLYKDGKPIETYEI